MKKLENFYNREQVQRLTGYGECTARKIIHEINRKLEEQGYTVRRGYVSKKVFDAMFKI